MKKQSKKRHPAQKIKQMKKQKTSKKQNPDIFFWSVCVILLTLCFGYLVSGLNYGYYTESPCNVLPGTLLSKVVWKNEPPIPDSIRIKIDNYLIYHVYHDRPTFFYSSRTSGKEYLVNVPDSIIERISHYRSLLSRHGSISGDISIYKIEKGIWLAPKLFKYGEYKVKLLVVAPDLREGYVDTEESRFIPPLYIYFSILFLYLSIMLIYFVYAKKYFFFSIAIINTLIILGLWFFMPIFWAIVLSTLFLVSLSCYFWNIQRVGS